jgi:hypothetical protein
MKTYPDTSTRSFRKYKTGFSLIALFLFCINSNVSSQSPIKIYPSFGISFGFFNPKDVNTFIKNDLSHYNISTTIGSSDMFMYYELQGGLTMKLKRLDINGIAEYAIAPKWIVISDGNTNSYYFVRTSLGATADFYVPLGTSGKFSLFFGGGPLYNFVRYKTLKASAPGFRLQAGSSLQFGKFNLQPYLAFNYAKAVKKMTYSDFEMNYTGGQIGFIFSVHRL